MNKRQVIGWLAACTLLLSGCGAKPAGTAGTAEGAGSAAGAGAQTQAASSAQGTQDAPAAQGQGQQGQPGKRPAMNPQQMQMMGTFQALLMMDKQDGLSITKDEAAKLLPVVQDIAKAGQISDDQSSKLRDPLTDDQKKYVDSFADNMKQRMADRGNAGGQQAAGKGGGQKLADRGNSGSRGRGGDSSGAASSSDNAGGGNSAASNSGSAGSGNGSGSQGQGRTKNGGGGPGMGNRDIGQQLIDLLQSKTK